jgi:ribonuclease inhibitor
MQTIYIDPSRYQTPRDLHAALKAMLSLPEWYGMNADALYDCLSERRDLVNLWIASPGEGEVARALATIVAVVEDLGGEVRSLSS